MPDTILLVGGYGLPDRTASATRALGVARLFQSLGYEVILLGKIGLAVPPPEGPVEIMVDGVRCLDVRRPIAGRAFRPYDESAESVAAVIDSLPAGSVRAVSAYNYPARGAWSIIRACKARGVPAILDCTEWYGWEGRKIARNVLRMAMTEFRLRVLTRLAGNVICASRWFARTVAQQNLLLLPFVVDASAPKWRPEPPRVATPGGPRRFVYSGTAGVGMQKDRLPAAIEGFRTLHDHGLNFEFIIAGMTRDDYLRLRPDHAAVMNGMDGKLRFLGRIPHPDALALLRGADFSVFFRKPNRVSHTGFATKYVEAASLGIPVISNATSDLPRYLTDGVNGFMAPGLSAVELGTTLERAARLDDAALLAMKRACAAANPFDLTKWQADTRAFMARLRLPR
ncbi:MAG: glycosyltransferase [Brevundimonas sp.]